jgi:hypothetical protein
MRFAVTGHRWHRLPVDCRGALPARVRQGLQACQAERPTGGTPWLLTGLAEGVDRIAAQEALLIGWRLHAMLPFAVARYERDFESADSVAQFRRILEQCQRVDELPGDEDGVDGRDGPYVELGHRLVLGADAVLAVWDRRPHGGPGGTADVVSRALATGRPVIWIDVSDPALPMRRAAAPGEWADMT